MRTLFTLVRLLWWSVLWHGARRGGRHRRLYREKVVRALMDRYQANAAWTDPVRLKAPLLSLWLGATLAARSAPTRGGPTAHGRSLRAALRAALLAWRWLGPRGDLGPLETQG